MLLLRLVRDFAIVQAYALIDVCRFTFISQTKTRVVCNLSMFVSCVVDHRHNKVSQ
jgi:hypothetical protein